MQEYKLIRTRRRTVAIYVTKEAEVEVRAPMCMPESMIDGFVKSRREWIEKHVDLRRCALAQKALFEVNYTSAVLFRGKSVEITADETRRGFCDGRFCVPPGLSPGEIKAELKRQYIGHAGRILPERTEHFAARMGVHPEAVRVNGAKAQWGSCSGKNRINYSWRLIMADDEVIDYVAVHELAHIRQHNHSPRFWAEVGAVFPDYRARIERLYELQARLINENWE